MAFMTKYELLKTYAYIWIVLEQQRALDDAGALQMTGQKRKAKSNKGKEASLENMRRRLGDIEAATNRMLQTLEEDGYLRAAQARIESDLAFANAKQEEDRSGDQIRPDKTWLERKLAGDTDGLSIVAACKKWLWALQSTGKRGLENIREIDFQDGFLEELARHTGGEDFSPFKAVVRAANEKKDLRVPIVACFRHFQKNSEGFAQARRWRDARRKELGMWRPSSEAAKKLKWRVEAREVPGRTRCWEFRT